MKRPPKYDGPLYETAFEAKIGPEEQRAIADAERAMKSAAYANADHPDHQRVVEGVADLFTVAYGSPSEIAARLEKKGE